MPGRPDPDPSILFLCLPGTCCGVIVVYIVSRDYCYLCYILVVAAVAVVAGDFVVVGCYLWLFSTPRYTLNDHSKDLSGKYFSKVPKASCYHGKGCPPSH